MKKEANDRILQQSMEFDAKLLAVNIQEAHELLVRLPEGEEGLMIAPDVSEDRRYVREGLIAPLLCAQERARAQQANLYIVSAYRSLSFQKRLFAGRYGQVQAENPDASHEELLHRANTYTAGIPILAAHTAGAAVDVLFMDPAGKALDFGVPYRHGGAESATDYEHVSAEAAYNRQALLSVMQQSGFSNYPFEYWHFSLGDACDAVMAGKAHAVYGPVEFVAATEEHMWMPQDQYADFFNLASEP